MTVLITATGLRGKKPLINRINVIKGSRQNKYVTLGKMLAPKSMLRVCWIRGKASHFAAYYRFKRRFCVVLAEEMLS